MCLPTNEIPPHSQSPAHGLNRQLCQRMRTHASFWGKKRQFGANFGIPCFGVKTPKSLNFRVPFTPPILGPKPPNSPVLEPHFRLHFRTPILGQKTPIWGNFGIPHFVVKTPKFPHFGVPFKPPILGPETPNPPILGSHWNPPIPGSISGPQFWVKIPQFGANLGNFGIPLFGVKPPKFPPLWGPL